MSEPKRRQSAEYEYDRANKAEAEVTRLREQRDAERAEVARLRERLEVEMANTDQLKAANAVCEKVRLKTIPSAGGRGVWNYQNKGIVDVWRVWEATQKGGDE